VKPLEGSREGLAVASWRWLKIRLIITPKYHQYENGSKALWPLVWVRSANRVMVINR